MRALVKMFRFIVQLQGAVVQGVELDRGRNAVVIAIRRRRNARARCSTCNTPMGGAAQAVKREWRHLNLIGRWCLVRATIREARCPRHGRRLERVPWASPRARHTRPFDLQVASLAQVADKTATQRMFEIAWRTVGGIVQRVVTERLGRDRFAELYAVGVDETSYKRGHRYITVVTNLLTGRVVWVGEGKSGATLDRFFDQLGAARCAKIVVVTMDMSEAYRNAVERRAPQADIVYDRFHVVKLLLDAVDEVRREESRTLEGPRRDELKHTRFAFLRNPRHLTPRDRDAIARVQRCNNRLARLYQYRVDFEHLWTYSDERRARTFIKLWTRSALLSRIEPLRRFARTVRTHIEGILGFFRYYRLTNANLEGTNNKIKLIIHRSFGFHSVDSLFAMIHLCCSGIDLQAPVLR